MYGTRQRQRGHVQPYDHAGYVRYVSIEANDTIAPHMRVQACMEHRIVAKSIAFVHTRRQSCSTHVGHASSLHTATTFFLLSSFEEYNEMKLRPSSANGSQEHQLWHGWPLEGNDIFISALRRNVIAKQAKISPKVVFKFAF